MGSEEKANSENNIAKEISPEAITKSEIIEQLKKELLENCYPIRYLVICKDDKVMVRVGRYWWHGTVLKVGKLGITLLNDARKTSCALGKISTITILEEGEYSKKYREIFGTSISYGEE